VVFPVTSLDIPRNILKLLIVFAKLKKSDIDLDRRRRKRILKKKNLCWLIS